MRPVASAGRCVIELARLLLRRGDEIGERLVRQVGADQHHGGQIGDMDDRGEGGVRIVGKLGAEHMRDGVRPDLGEEQVIAIRLFAHDRGGRDGAAGAGPVLDDQRLAVGEL